MVFNKLCNQSLQVAVGRTVPLALLSSEDNILNLLDLCRRTGQTTTRCIAADILKTPFLKA